MNAAEKKLYDIEMTHILANPDYKDKPIEMFFQMIRTADTFGAMGDFCDWAGIYRGSYKNWLYGGELPQLRNFVKILAAMGYDVKIVKRR